MDTPRSTDPQLCACGKKEIVVLLLGETQHGKSSLFKGILKYGGYEDRAGTIETGRNGMSVTKEPRTEVVTIDIKKHFLRFKSGSRAGVKVDLTYENAAMYSSQKSILEAATESLGGVGHVHLRIIDTPGLDDSRQGNTHATDIDEKHKMTILKTLYDAGSIGSVCLFSKCDEVLKETHIANMRRFVQMFDLSLPGVKYDIVHTIALTSKMNGNFLKNRPIEIERELQLENRVVAHHFIDSVWNKYDILSRQFTNAGIARFLQIVGQSQSHSIDQLRFPKGESHIIMDQELLDIIGSQKLYHNRCIEKSRIAISELEDGKSTLQRSQGPEEARLELKRKERQKYDSDDKVQIGYDFKRSGRQLFEFSTLEFSVTAPCKIRTAPHDQSSNSEWIDIDWLALLGIPGVRNVYGKLRSKSMFSEIWGEIRLFGYKRDLWSEEVRQAKKEEAAVIGKIEDIKSKLHSTNNGMRAHKAKIGILEKRIKDRDEEVSYLQEDSVSFGVILENQDLQQYLSMPNIICYALGYQELLAAPREIEAILAEAILNTIHKDFQRRTKHAAQERDKYISAKERRGGLDSNASQSERSELDMTCRESKARFLAAKVSREIANPQHKVIHIGILGMLKKCRGPSDISHFDNQMKHQLQNIFMGSGEKMDEVFNRILPETPNPENSQPVAQETRTVRRQSSCRIM